MTGRNLWMVAATAAAFLGGGCNPPLDEPSQAPKPQAVAFEGQIEPKYVGLWKTPDGNSSIELLKDGGANIETVSRSMLGKSDVKVSGKWLCKGDSLLVSYLTKMKEPVVLKYTATLSGKELTLGQAGGRLKTKYRRK